MTFTQMPTLFRLRQMLPVQVHSAAGMQVSATGALRLLPATGLLLIGTWPAGQALQVLSGIATSVTAHATQTPFCATWCAPQEMQLLPSALGTWKDGHDTQLF